VSKSPLPNYHIVYKLYVDQSVRHHAGHVRFYILLLADPVQFVARKKWQLLKKIMIIKLFLGVLAAVSETQQSCR